MELLIYILLIALVIYLLYLLIRYIILPIASIVGVITLVVSAGYGLVVSLMSFASSVKENLDPYETYVDNHADIPAGVKRNYCFGPGFHQIAEIAKGAFAHLRAYRNKLTAWKENAVGHGWYIDIWIHLGYLFAIFCAQVLGFIWTAIFSALLAAVILIGMVGFFLFFSVLWLTDRGVLLVKSIHNRCPSCKRKSVIPVFVCPTCGQEHKKLVPGPYGVMKRKCSCGTMLSTTFLGGRSAYEAHCPFCDTELFSSTSQQYGLQLVGGVGTGKTTFLAAFWHEYKDWLRKNGVSYELSPSDAFLELEEWFQSGRAEATMETNASMYSIIHSTGPSSSVQMTVYDIAGEAFDFAEGDVQQQQFRYCEGFLLVLDPTADPDYVSATVTNFINSLNEVKGKHAAKAASVPVAVLITKSDIHKKEIGLPRIKATYQPAGEDGTAAESFEQHRDDVCRDFLLSHGYDNALNLIEAEFAHIRFFPVSAMGHDMESGQYEPWGILEPVFWLMSHENCPLHGLIQGDTPQRD